MYKIVLFYRIGKNHYFIYDEIKAKVTEKNIQLLKEILPTPYILEFKGFSRANMSRVISSLYDDNMTVRFKKGQALSNRALHYIVMMNEKEKEEKIIHS